MVLTALDLEVLEGELLLNRGNTFWTPGDIDNATGSITGINAAVLGTGSVSGAGTLLTIAFTAKDSGESPLDLWQFKLGDSAGNPIVYQFIAGRVTIAGFPPWDVNEDGTVDLFDLIAVAQGIGQQASKTSRIDVKNDGIIDIFDLIIVAQHFGESTVPLAPRMPDVTHEQSIQQWLAEARRRDDGSTSFQRGIAVLEYLLNMIRPRYADLLQNYPNPFNPETWIPYQLATDADVQVRIYDIRGALVC